MPSKEYSRRGTKNESFKNGDYNKKNAHESAPVTDFKDFDVDQFLFDHRVSIVVKIAISVLLYAAVITAWFLIFRYNGYSFGGFALGVAVGFVAFVICLEIDTAIYKNLIKKSIKSIKEIIAFGYEPKRFIYGKYLSLSKKGIFSLSTEDATTIKIGDIKTVEYEFKISQKGIDNKEHTVFNGEYINCANNQERADEIMVVCGSFFPANKQRISIPVNKDESDPKYKIFALTTENLDASDIGYVRHIADKVYDMLKARPHMVYFKKGSVEVIYQIPDLSKYDHSMLFFGELRKDFESLGERLNFARRLSADDYVEQENGGGDVIAPLAELNTVVEEEKPVVEEEKPVVEEEKPVVEEENNDQRREPFPRKRPLATFKAIENEILERKNINQFIRENKWKMTLATILKIIMFVAWAGLFVWIVIKTYEAPPVLLLVIFVGIPIFAFGLLFITGIFADRYVALRDKMFQRFDNIKWLHQSVPTSWNDALVFNKYEDIQEKTEDVSEITFGNAVITEAELNLYYEIAVDVQETKQVDLFAGIFMKVKPDEPFADNIMIVKGNMPYKPMPVRYKDNIYAMSQNDIEISDIERAENIAENLSSYMKYNFILLFRGGEVLLFIKGPIRKIFDNGVNSKSSWLKNAAAAVAHRMQIAHILAEQ